MVLGESTLFIDATVSLFPFIFQYRYGEVETQLICLVPLLYIVFSTYIPLFQLKLKGGYGLYKNNHTDPANLIWSACFMARLIPALSFNFILLLKVKDTQFSKVMKVIDLVPYIGIGFAEFFPLLLIVFCLLNAFDIHTRLMFAIGLGQFTFSEVLETQRIVEGQTLIAQARLEREKNVREANNYSVKIIGKVSDESKSLKRPLRNK